MTLCRLGLSWAPLGSPAADEAACQAPEQEVKQRRAGQACQWRGASTTKAWDRGTMVSSARLWDPQDHQSIRCLCMPCIWWASSEDVWRGGTSRAGSGRGSPAPCVPWCSAQPGQDPWGSQDLSHLLLLANQELFCRKLYSHLWGFKPNRDPISTMFFQEFSLSSVSLGRALDSVCASSSHFPSSFIYAKSMLDSSQCHCKQLYNLLCILPSANHNMANAFQLSVHVSLEQLFFWARCWGLLCLMKQRRKDVWSGMEVFTHLPIFMLLGRWEQSCWTIKGQ